MDKEPDCFAAVMLYGKSQQRWPEKDVTPADIQTKLRVSCPDNMGVWLEIDGWDYAKVQKGKEGDLHCLPVSNRIDLTVETAELLIVVLTWMVASIKEGEGS